jgi:hypothetical protein
MKDISRIECCDPQVSVDGSHPFNEAPACSCQLLGSQLRLDRAERSLRPPRPSGANSPATLGPHADAPRSRHPGAAKTRRCAVPGCREPSVCQPLHGCVAYRLARHDSGESRSVWRVGVVGR